LGDLELNQEINLEAAYNMELANTDLHIHATLPTFSIAGLPEEIYLYSGCLFVLFVTLGFQATAMPLAMHLVIFKSPFMSRGERWFPNV
jgi:hypothetical protein